MSKTMNKVLESIQDPLAINRFLSHLDHNALSDVMVLLEYCDEKTKTTWQSAYNTIFDVK